MISLPSLDDTLAPELAMVAPFSPVVAWALFDAESNTVEELREHLLRPALTPYDALLTLLRSVDVARRHHGPVVPWTAWTPTFRALAEHDWEATALQRVLLLASCRTPPDFHGAQLGASGRPAPASVPARAFEPAFWAAFLPVAQPLVHMISDRLDAAIPQIRVWDAVRQAMASHDLEAWLIRQNIWARAEGKRPVSLAQCNALRSWNDGRYTWDILVLALLWRAVSDRREPDPILDLGGTHSPA